MPNPMPKVTRSASGPSAPPAVPAAQPQGVDPDVATPGLSRVNDAPAVDLLGAAPSVTRLPVDLAERRAALEEGVGEILGGKSALDQYQALVRLERRLDGLYKALARPAAREALGELVAMGLGELGLRGIRIKRGIEDQDNGSACEIGELQFALPTEGGEGVDWVATHDIEWGCNEERQRVAVLEDQLATMAMEVLRDQSKNGFVVMLHEKEEA